MTNGEREDAMRRGELLVNLRHGVRHSARLAEQLVDDMIVGNEARALLCRLQNIRNELDSLTLVATDLRYPVNDPFWSQTSTSLRQGGVS